MTDKPQQVIGGMDAATYFNMMARLMGGAAPPAPEDAPIVARMAKIGLPRASRSTCRKLDAETQAALKKVPETAQATIFAKQSTSGFLRNGWHIPAAAGAYGTNYLARALVAAFGWPANLPQTPSIPMTPGTAKAES